MGSAVNENLRGTARVLNLDYRVWASLLILLWLLPYALTGGVTLITNRANSRITLPKSTPACESSAESGNAQERGANTGLVASSNIERQMRPDDLLHIRRIDNAAISPDGCWIALVIERPRNIGDYFERPMLQGQDRADIWLVRSDGSNFFNLTKGDADHAGYWGPVWSPDSGHLAVLSTRGNENVRLFLWNRKFRRLRRLTEEGIDIAAEITTAGGMTGPPMAWLSPSRLLTITLPSGYRPLWFDEDQRTQDIEAAGAAQAMRGTAVTANVISTQGVSADLHVPLGLLTAIEVDTGRRAAIARVPVNEMRLSRRLLTLSPDRNWATLIAPGLPKRIRLDRPLVLSDAYPMRLGVVSLQMAASVHWFDGLSPKITSMSFDQAIVRWNPESSRLAVLVEASSDPSRSVGEVALIDPRSTAIESVSKAGESVSDLQWTGNTGLIVKLRQIDIVPADMISRDPANQRNLVNSDLEERRSDWWLVQGERIERNVTDQFPQPVERSLGMLDGTHWLAFSAGQLWSVDLNTRKAAEVSFSASSIISQVVWVGVRGDGYLDRLIVKVSEETNVVYYEVEISGGKVAWKRLGLKGADRIAAVEPRAGGFAYVTPDTKLLLAKFAAEEPRKLVSLNDEIGRIAYSKTVALEYKTADGRPLKGVLLLPYAYQTGKRYPLVTVVYGGIADPTHSFDHSTPYNAAAENFLLLAAHGYAVLAPSMPLQPMGLPSDPLLELDKGVAPAIQAVIDMGVADPNRLALWGWSYGGYSVYGLLTQTQRFRAAIAIAGVSDLVSLYGTFDRRYRYSPYGGGPWLGPYILESQQFRMGLPLWIDSGRYVRNSPVTHADRVHTPLLMIQGTNDPFSAEQAEEFFSALNRLGEPAELVRYIGEGHTIESPLNILDFWQRVYAWYDDFLDISRNEKGDLLWDANTLTSRAQAATGRGNSAIGTKPDKPLSPSSPRVRTLFTTLRQH